MFFNLSGTMADKGKFVVSLATSESTLANLSDLISASFDYYNYEKIYFEKNGVVIDRFGKDDVTTFNYDVFDIGTFLADPNLLASMNLNLQSLEDIDLRRHPLKTEGDVVWNGIIDNWYPYTTANFNDVGEHQGICSGDAVLGWTVKKIEENESNTSNINTTVNINGTLQALTNIGFTTANFVFGSGLLNIANPLNTVSDFTINHTNITNGSISNATAPMYLGNINNDNLIEDTESSYFVLSVPNNGDYIIDDQNNILTFKVIDDDNTTSIHNANLKEEFSVFPVVFNKSININYSNNISILEIEIINSQGQKIEFNNDNNKVLSFNTIPSAYYFLFIQTNKGSLSYKILKK